jgi:carbon storage regulator
MLVLGRKVNERILIGDDIVITVVALLRDKVRLGVECPRDIPVHREEVAERIRQEGDRSRARKPPGEHDPGKEGANEPPW